MGKGNGVIRVAVAGVGHHGRHHARLFSSMEGVRLVGVIDIDPETAGRVASEYGTKGVTTPDELAEPIDAVSIAVPALNHFKVAGWFIERGIHIFMEKPVTETSEQASELAVMVGNAGIIFQSGHIERFNPAISALSSVITRPRFIEAHRLCIYNPRGCDVGVVMDLMVHDLDIVLHLVRSNVKNISAVGVNVLSPTEDIANARLEFDDGCIANITASRVSSDNMRKIRIFQPDSYISLDYRKQEGMIFRKTGNTIESQPVPTTKSEPLKLQLESFINCVRTGSAPAVSLEDGRRVIEIAETIRRDISARNKM